MRSFELKNNLGQSMDLNADQHFFMKVKGLGMERKLEFEKTSSSWLVMEDVLKQKTIQGVMNFDDYEGYEEFVKFVQHEPLTMVYQSNTTIEVQVRVEQLEKGEVEATLQCPIRFVNVCEFYKKVHVQSEIAIEGSGKKYPRTYPYKYRDNISGSIDIFSETKKESPVKLTIFGPCLNPSWSHYVDGKLKTSGKVGNETLPCDIQAGERLVIDTTSVPWTIHKLNQVNEFLLDCYQMSDWETERFILLQYGANKITATQEGSEAITMAAEGYLMYETL